ncbi:hypothetical protein DB032_23405 [Chromobacterium sp. Panama]|nr:hypothetical protein DB032_23405 [Chromobacterium sp. Panama]
MDFLRGIFILMAIFQHYTGYLNYWYIDFFHHEQAYHQGVYDSHLPMLGKFNPMDELSRMLAMYLIPWVSQIYLMLAAFNLALRDQQASRTVMWNKLRLLGALLLVFVLEGFLISPSLGEALSFYPQMLWMILLALFCVVYSYAGVRGMLALAVLAVSAPWLLTGDPFAAFEGWMQANIHPAYEFDARVDLFAASGALGFLYGWLWAHRPYQRAALNYWVLAISASCLALYFYSGESPQLSAEDIYSAEHELALSFSGLLGILGMEFGVVALVLILHERGIALCWRPLNWIGFYSLTVFIFHKVLFIHLFGPVLQWVTARLDTTMPNNFFLNAFLVLCAVAAAWVIKRSGVVDRLTGSSQDGQWERLCQAWRR